jgi:hypothetical protein
MAILAPLTRARSAVVPDNRQTYPVQANTSAAQINGNNLILIIF